MIKIGAVAILARLTYWRNGTGGMAGFGITVIVYAEDV
jgi:hypothetical protein